ncbi:hypothetical protein, partial [Paraburkholderia sp. SIMBA_030]|uniref:hypothetical protein n=1 Tax=Paraburkholderia sp. SIMBA_030 TaxID=3085773 RepID=UPI0039794613
MAGTGQPSGKLYPHGGAQRGHLYAEDARRVRHLRRSPPLPLPSPLQVRRCLRTTSHFGERKRTMLT